MTRFAPVLAAVALALTASARPQQTVTSLWEVQTGVFRGPWLITLAQSGKAISGTIQQSFPVICATEPFAFDNGSLETRETGDEVSFDLAGPRGVVTFKGVLNDARDAIAFTRSASVLRAGSSSFKPSSPAAEADDDNGFLRPDGETRFVAHRIDPTTAPRSDCRIPETPRLRPDAPEARRYVVTARVGFPPWTFDLIIRNGVVTGTVSQGRTDPTSRMTATVVGPFPIADGHSDGTSIDFSIALAEGARVATFHGRHSGAEAIVFTRQMTVVRVLSGADPGLTGIFGPEAVTRFTAVLDPTFQPPPATSISSSPSGGDDTVTLAAVDASYAASTATGFALARYHVGSAFGGRLLLTITDGANARVRQFEVTATPGDHLALWNLRRDAAGARGDPPAAQSAHELATAESRAALAADVIHLAADEPDEAARLTARLAPLIVGPRDAASTARAIVGPGMYFCALSRVDAGGPTTVASLPVEVRAGGVR